jgi:glycine cleavage system pyridoxal-binding protein P
MPDLITIQGDVASVRSLTDIATLEIIDDTGKLIDQNTAIVAAFADDAAKAAVQARGLTVNLIKTEAQYEADIQQAYEAISNVPYDFGGNV